MPRIILIIIGWLAVALGTLGVFCLIADHPFILLAARCFARSSPRFHHWLLYRSGSAVIFVTGSNIVRCRLVPSRGRL